MSLHVARSSIQAHLTINIAVNPPGEALLLSTSSRCEQILDCDYENLMNRFSRVKAVKTPSGLLQRLKLGRGSGRSQAAQRHSLDADLTARVGKKK